MKCEGLELKPEAWDAMSFNSPGDKAVWTPAFAMVSCTAATAVAIIHQYYNMCLIILLLANL